MRAGRTLVFIIASIMFLNLASALHINDTTFLSSISNSTIWTNNIILDQITVESEYTDFYNLQNWGLFNNTNVTYNAFIHYYNLTTPLIYFSNGTVACADIPNCANQINITLQPNNHSYVLDNYNITIGASDRSNDPLWTPSTSLLNSTLTDTITSLVHGGGTTLSLYNGTLKSGTILTYSQFSISEDSYIYVT